jgi:Tfp pilus assembly protein PilN
MITINFASKNYRLIENIRTGLIAGSVVLSIIMAGMVWKTVSMRSSVSAMEGKLKEAAAADEQTAALLHERQQIVKDLNSMSGLMESKKFSWTRLLTSIETVVPRGVALTHVEFITKERTVLLDGVAQSPESLRSLLVGLEQSASFKSPFLKHQSLEKGNLLFNVITVYQEHNTAGVALSKR